MNADFQCGVKMTRAEIGGESIHVYNNCKDGLPSQYWFVVLLFSIPQLVLYIDARDVPGLADFEGHDQDWRARKMFIAGFVPAFNSVDALRAWATAVDMPRMAIGRQTAL